MWTTERNGQDSNYNCFNLKLRKKIEKITYENLTNK